LKSSQVFRENVKKLMERQGLKVKDLAEMVNLSSSYLSLILSGERGNLSDDHKDALALALGVSVADLYLPPDMPSMVPSETAGSTRRESWAPYREVGRSVPNLKRDTSAFEDFLRALNITDDLLLLAFYREINKLSDEEVTHLGDVLRNVLVLWQEKRMERNEAGVGREPYTPDFGRSEARKLPLDHDLRRLVGAIAALQGVLGDVPLKFLEVALSLKAWEVLAKAGALEETGLIVLVEKDRGISAKVTSPFVLERALEWISPAFRKDLLFTLAKKAEEEHLSLSYTETAQLYLEAGEMASARLFYQKAAEESFSLQKWREAREVLLVIASLDRFLKSSPDETAVINQMMVTTCFNLGDLDLARMYQERNLAYWEKGQCLDDLLKGYAMMSTILVRQGNWSSAVAYLDKALGLVSKDPLGEARVRISLAGLLTERGLLTRAREELERALDIASRIGEEGLMAQALLGTGRVFLYRGDYPRSTTFLNRALALSEKKEPSIESLVRMEMGKSLLQQGNLKGARSQFEKSVDLADHIGDIETKNLAAAYLWRCMTGLREHSDLNKARDMFHGFWMFFSRRKHPEGVVVSLLGEAEVLYASGDLAGASSTFMASVRSARDGDNPFLESLSCQAYANCLETEGDELASVLRQRSLWARGKMR